MGFIHFTHTESTSPVAEEGPESYGPILTSLAYAPCLLCYSDFVFPFDVIDSTGLEGVVCVYELVCSMDDMYIMCILFRTCHHISLCNKNNNNNIKRELKDVYDVYKWR